MLPRVDLTNFSGGQGWASTVRPIRRHNDKETIQLLSNNKRLLLLWQVSSFRGFRSVFAQLSIYQPPPILWAPLANLNFFFHFFYSLFQLLYFIYYFLVFIFFLFCFLQSRTSFRSFFNFFFSLFILFWLCHSLGPSTCSNEALVFLFIFFVYMYGIYLSIYN